MSAVGVPSRERWRFFALSALALGPSVLYYWLAVHSYVRAPVHSSPVGLSNRPVRVRERLAVVAARRFHPGCRRRDLRDAVAQAAARLAPAGTGRNPAKRAGRGNPVPAVAASAQ